MKIVIDNILNAREKYIAHQCNCVTITAKGLCQSINNKYPWANAYYDRQNKEDIPGTIKIYESPSQDKAVICMFAQLRPSKPFKSKTDTYEQRIKWFQECLIKIKEVKIQTDAIAFPWMIGCGLAGGDWNIYKKMLDNFEKESNIEVILYKLN